MITAVSILLVTALGCLLLAIVSGSAIALSPLILDITILVILIKIFRKKPEDKKEKNKHYCSECGTELKGEIKFCPMCGTEIEN